MAGFCMQLLAIHWYPDMCQHRISQSAKPLRVALYFANLLAELLSSVLNHPTLLLYDRRNALLLLPRFWVRPLYNELVYAVSRVVLSPSRNLIDLVMV